MTLLRYRCMAHMGFLGPTRVCPATPTTALSTATPPRQPTSASVREAPIAIVPL